MTAGTRIYAKTVLTTVSDTWGKSPGDKACWHTCASL